MVASCELHNKSRSVFLCSGRRSRIHSWDLTFWCWCVDGSCDITSCVGSLKPSDGLWACLQSCDQHASPSSCYYDVIRISISAPVGEQQWLRPLDQVTMKFTCPTNVFMVSCSKQEVTSFWGSFVLLILSGIICVEDQILKPVGKHVDK